MRDHQVPPVVDDVQHVTLVVRSGALGRQQVAGPCIMALLDEGVANDARELAGDQDFHALSSSSPYGSLPSTMALMASKASSTSYGPSITSSIRSTARARSNGSGAGSFGAGFSVNTEPHSVFATSSPA